MADNEEITGNTGPAVEQETPAGELVTESGAEQQEQGAVEPGEGEAETPESPPAVPAIPGVVTWDEAAWREAYPQFNVAVTDDEGNVITAAGAMPMTSGQLAAMWMQAVTLVDNSPGAVIPYDAEKGVEVRKVVLWALMCHLATLAYWQSQGQTGPMTNASEGSVSAGFAQLQNWGKPWWNQTQCGQTAWAIMMQYTMGGRYYGITYRHPSQ